MNKQRTRCTPRGMIQYLDRPLVKKKKKNRNKTKTITTKTKTIIKSHRAMFIYIQSPRNLTVFFVTMVPRRVGNVKIVRKKTGEIVLSCCLICRHWWHRMVPLWKYPLLPRDDVIKRKHFPRYWPFVWGNYQSPVNSPHKGQWRGALMFSLICAWINGWVNHHEAGDFETPSWSLWRHCNEWRQR